MKKKLRQNKVLLVLAIILLICFAVILFVLFKYFYVGNNSNKYGDRLSDIESHKIHNTLESDLNDLYKDSKMSLKSLKVNGNTALKKNSWSVKFTTITEVLKLIDLDDEIEDKN